MPAEIFTKTSKDVGDRVRAIFGDTSGAQIDDETLLRWINDGQQEIVNNNAILKASKMTNITSGIAEYSFPSDRVQYIEAIYVNGRPIKNMSPQETREYILSQDPSKSAVADIPEVWYERAGVITFYPTPNKDYTNGLKLEYVKMPTAINGIGQDHILSIPDRYLNELVNYCTTQALELDENYAAAEYKNRQFRDGLNRLSSKENISQIDLYVQVMPDPDDYRV
jgi:hypothetical protein